MKNYTYLVFDLALFFFPFVLSFETRLFDFRKYFAQIFIVISVLTMGFFLLSHYFIINGVYALNPLYSSGKSIYLVPIDEIIFYFAWGYFCLFSYQIIKKFLAKYIKTTFRVPALVVGVLFIAYAVWEKGKIYPLWMGMGAGFLLLLHAFLLKSRFIGVMLLAASAQVIVFCAIRGFFAFLPMYQYKVGAISNIAIKGWRLDEIIFAVLFSILSITVYEFIKQRKNETKKYAS